MINRLIYGNKDSVTTPVNIDSNGNLKTALSGGGTISNKAGGCANSQVKYGEWEYSSNTHSNFWKSVPFIFGRRLMVGNGQQPKYEFRRI